MSLVEAIQQIQKLSVKIGQHPAPRESIATALGYSGLHGSSATAVSALGKFGLLEKQGEDYRLSERAMKIIAPHSPAEKSQALEDAANDPVLFAELNEHFPGTSVAADEVLRPYLIRKGFAQSAVPAVITAYRETRELVTREKGNYVQGAESHVPDLKNEDAQRRFGKSFNDFFKTGAKSIPPSGARLMEGERELTTGLLSKNASFRLIVSGEVGPKEIERLIAKLKLDKDILADTGVVAAGPDPIVDDKASEP